MGTNEIACSICDKKYPVLDQVEPSERSTWVGPEHQRGEISVVPYNVIRHRIALTNTQDENAGRMVLRELVQNADDAGARILVLRFEDDALYVANDGRAFSTGTRGPNRGDFDRIGEILGGHKREDPDSTGKFGSGFQTVYLITNAPEVHSSGLWAQMDPVNQRMPTRAIGDGGGFITPYASGTESGHTGVVFRLPWRDDDAAETEYGTHGKPFSDSRDFPRWNPQKKVELFDDLVDYSRHVLLCCKTLLTIRLVWDAHGERKACQSRRDFALKGLAGEPRVGTVSAGKLAVEEEWFRWPSIERRDAGARHEWPSFHLKNFRWEGSCSQLRFFIASAPVSTADGRELFIGEDGSKENRELLITQDSTQLRNQAPSMRNDVHLLIPMFDALSQGPDKGFAFHYSTVPLPKRSRNWFAFTGPFFPDESRLDVRIMGLEGEWGRHIVASVGRLYATVFPELVTRAQGLSLEVVEKQSILLNAIPTVPLHQWMRLEEQNGEWARPTQTAIVSLFPSSPIFASQERWIPPDHARWVTIEGLARNDCSTVLALMHEPVFPERFTTHPSFLGTLAPLLDSRKLTATQFKEIFRQYLSRSGGRLYHGRGHKDHGQHSLTRPDTEALVRFCLTRTERWADLGDLPGSPGKGWDTPSPPRVSALAPELRGAS